MSGKDKVTIFISVVALLISGMNFFFSQLYESNELEVVVMEVDLTAGRLAPEGYLVYEVAIINPGNRKALIKSANLLLSSEDRVLHTSNPLAGVGVRPELPIVVDAKDIVLLRFAGGIRFDELYQRGGAPDGGGHDEFNGVRTRKIKISAHFDSMDFRGIGYHAETGVMTAHITPENVATGGNDGSKRSLFRRQ